MSIYVRVNIENQSLSKITSNFWKFLSWQIFLKVTSNSVSLLIFPNIISVSIESRLMNCRVLLMSTGWISILDANYDGAPLNLYCIVPLNSTTQHTPINLIFYSIFKFQVRENQNQRQFWQNKTCSGAANANPRVVDLFSIESQY